MLWQTNPTCLLLALDISFARLPLRVEGVELLLQPFFGGLAGVDSTTDVALDRCLRRLGHGASPLPRMRKNRKPLVWEPVMALATAESDRYTAPSNSNPWG